MKRFNIAVLPGDGIGVDVTAAAVEVLNALGLRLAFEEFSIGAGEYLKNGDPLPEAVMTRLPAFDAIFLGAAGLPGVRWPSGTEIAPQLDLRERFDLYCGLRPVYLFHPDDSPLRDKPAGSIDILLVRESTEGLFSGRHDRNTVTADRAEDRLVITKHGAERVIRAAFRQAMARRKHLTLVDKANVLPSMAFFRGVFDRIAEEFPEVETQRIYVDAAALYLVQCPESFDVLVTENMFGDILSDLLAGIVGGMGMAPSADIGENSAVFQPSHGSAPDIAGKGIANPVAAILSAAMMLEWLGEPTGTNRIRAAVRTVFSDRRARTRDLGGDLTTSAMTAHIIAALPG
jgi:3-isopropylmalate dehydrogenase